MAKRVMDWLHSFECLLQQGDVRGAAELFHEDECFWRDRVAFTWNYYTAESREDIQAMLQATLEEARPCGWQIEGDAEERENGNLVEAFIRFETARARGKGRVKLRGDKCWCLLTAMQELKGHEEKLAESGKEEQVMQDHLVQPYCLIVGGGQSAMALAAYLRQLGVPTIIVEKHRRAGDSWRKRYRALQLHTPVWADHLPYLPFPDNWPLFSSKDEIANWLEAYSQAMDLVYWTCTECKSARFDEAAERWEVRVEREGDGGLVETMIYPKQLVLATSLFGIPSRPSFKGAQNFEGVQMHSTEFEVGLEGAGKQCVVIGSNTTAHDIAADLWRCGAAQVTMLQRSPTLVVPLEPHLELLRHAYCNYSTENADLLVDSIPYKLLPHLHRPIYKQIEEEFADFYQGLREAGFQHYLGEDEAGMHLLLLQRGAGFYIDMGASELVIKGDVKVKSGVQVEEVTASSVVLSDGSEVQAELIVYATGYEGGMTGTVAKLISQEVADKVGKCWGVGYDTSRDPGPWERELRNMWKPTRQPGLWFHGGGFTHARLNSRYLALQLKARMEGIPTPVYGMPHVHHIA